MNLTVRPVAVGRILGQRVRVPAQRLRGGGIVPEHLGYTVTLELAGGDTVTFAGDSFANLRALLAQLQMGLAGIDPADSGSDRFEPSWPVALLDLDGPDRPRGGGRR